MAEVFRAVGEGPEGFERPFVIKRIHPRLSEAPEFVRMFVDEAKISARLVHPNIVQVFDFAPEDGGYYIVMEPVDGFDMGWLLRRRLESRREVPPPAFVAEIGRQACRGLDFAHTLTSADGKPLGIVHRDVTPPNIMVTWNGTVKIVDFGIARAVEALRASVTDAGMVKGKMSYVAPELLEGKTADARSDVFSLGVVLHELLSGRQLFVGENDLDTLRLVKTMEIPPPSARNPGVKRALDAVVMRALERDPDKRYPSAGAMGDDLETVVLRERYSTRALARKARELADLEEVPSQAQAQASSAIVEETIEVPDSGSLLIPESGAVAVPVPLAGSSPSQSPSAPIATGAAKRPPATPPRLPPRVPTPAPVAAGSLTSSRWTWIAVALPSALALVVVLMRRPPPPPPTPAPPATVHVALDSTPQGATVTAGAVVVNGSVQGGHSLGETPLLLDLPRGSAAVEVVLTRDGFIPLPFKVLPHQDREVLAQLEHLPPPPPPVVEPVVALVRPRRRSAASSAGRTPLATPGARPPVAGSTPTAPARTVAVGQPRTLIPAPAAPAAHPPASALPIMRR